MARENNQNGSLVDKSQNLSDLDVKRAVEKKAVLLNQSLKVQLKSIFNPFSCESLSLINLLVIWDNSANSNSIVKKIDMTSEFSRY
jgi:hypothetical protein